MMSLIDFDKVVNLIISKSLLETHRASDLMRMYPIIPFVIKLVHTMKWKFVDEQMTPIFLFYSESSQNDRYLPSLALRIHKNGNEKIVDLHNLSYAYSVKIVMDAIDAMGYFG